MNELDKNPNYKILWNEAKKLFKESGFFSYGCYDETFCTIRVFETAKEIMKILKNKNFNEQVVLVASIFHDVGKAKININKVFNKNGEDKKGADAEWGKHSILSPIIARKILKKYKYSDEFIEKVCYLIKNHDNKNLKNKTLELKILQDADLVGDSGIVDIARNFANGGQFKRSILDNIKRIKKFGILRYGDYNINLDESKKLIKEKNELLINLINDLDKLSNSELED
ncbi:MAG: HD domain-containing protein [Candidatus Nanoarchaeia archaeon]|nr:HD domain-containing protein [Candidatus Nanoarchaeia archaeon]